MDQPAVSVFVEGSREVVTAAQWPPKYVEYRPLYLRPRHKISSEPELMVPSTPRRTASIRRR
jgi:predicted acyl esterase